MIMTKVDRFITELIERIDNATDYENHPERSYWDGSDAT